MYSIVAVALPAVTLTSVGGWRLGLGGGGGSLVGE
jgi:hypothetical protein